MTFSSLLIHSVTIFPFVAGADDRYGDATDGFGSGVTVSGRINQVETTETEIDRDTRIIRAKLYLMPGTAIAATSEVVHGANRYRVDGEPKIAYDSSGAHHLEVELLRIDAG
jgi:hypothetical protein